MRERRKRRRRDGGRAGDPFALVRVSDYGTPLNVLFTRDPKRSEAEYAEYRRGELKAGRSPVTWEGFLRWRRRVRSARTLRVG